VVRVHSHVLELPASTCAGRGQGHEEDVVALLLLPLRHGPTLGNFRPDEKTWQRICPFLCKVRTKDVRRFDLPSALFRLVGDLRQGPGQNPVHRAKCHAPIRPKYG